jgi:hypothetical protein
MNKTVFITVLIWFATITSSVITHKVFAANIAQSICEYIAADDKKRMRSFLKTNKIKIRKIFKGTKCNNMNLLEFAVSKNSLKTGKLLISKLPKKVITDLLPILQNNPTLLEEANNRLN